MNNALVGRTVILTMKVFNVGGECFERGTRMKVLGSFRQAFTLECIKTGRKINNLPKSKFVVEGGE
jgi:hypothetical protein